MNDLMIIPELKNDGFKYLIEVEVYINDILRESKRKPYYLFFGCNDRQRDVFRFWSSYSYKTKMENPILPFLKVNKRIAEIQIDEHNKRQEIMIEKRKNPDYILKKMFENDEAFTNEEMNNYYRQMDIKMILDKAIKFDELPEDFSGMLFDNKHFFEIRSEKFTPRFIPSGWKSCYFKTRFLVVKESIISFLQQKYKKDRVIKRELKKIRKLFESKGNIEDYETALKEKARYLINLDLEEYFKKPIQRRKGEDNNG